MNSIVKFWLFLFVLCLASAVFINGVYSKDMLVEHSTALGKNRVPQKNLSELFSELGVAPFSLMDEDSEGNTMMNPCFDMEGYTLKYCSIHGLKLLLHEEAFASVEEQLFRKFLTGTDACEQVAHYIGRACELNNFKKIMKHFAVGK